MKIIKVNVYKIVTTKPWFWSIITLFSPAAKWGHVTLSLGNVIYTHRKLSEAEKAHERVHLRQDRYSKLVAIFNAIRCLFDKRYYLRSEIEAYKAQNKIEKNPQLYASYLSSPVYNNLISYEEALQLFK